MFAVGELILYGRTGVCRVEEIRETGGTAYYVLQPLYQTCSVTVPAASPKVFLRPLLSAAQVRGLLADFSTLEAEPYYNRNLNQLRAHYAACMDNRDSLELLRFAKSLRLKQRETAAQKKKFGSVDERYLREVEALLFGEFAAALGITRAEVENHIANCMAEA